jgi:hypothetical protein
MYGCTLMGEGSQRDGGRDAVAVRLPFQNAVKPAYSKTLKDSHATVICRMGRG